MRTKGLIVIAGSVCLGVFASYWWATSLDQALALAAPTGLALGIGLLLLESRCRVGPGEAHMSTFPIPYANVRGLLDVAGIIAVGVGWLLVGGALGTALVKLIPDTAVDESIQGMLALAVLLGLVVVGPLLTWEWFRRRIT